MAYSSASLVISDAFCQTLLAQLAGSAWRILSISPRSPALSAERRACKSFLNFFFLLYFKNIKKINFVKIKISCNVTKINTRN